MRRCPYARSSTHDDTSPTPATLGADSPFYHWWITAALMLGFTTAGLSVTVVQLAFPHIMTSLRTDLDTMQWVQTSAMIMQAVMMPSVGWPARGWAIGGSICYPWAPSWAAPSSAVWPGMSPRSLPFVCCKRLGQDRSSPSPSRSCFRPFRKKTRPGHGRQLPGVFLRPHGGARHWRLFAGTRQLAYGLLHQRASWPHRPAPGLPGAPLPPTTGVAPPRCWACCPWPCFW